MIRPILLMLAAAVISAADPTTQSVDYRDGDLALRGYLARPAKIDGATPGVLVVHDWFGCGPYAQQRARELADRGYIAFALDMYGGGKVAGERKEAAALAGGFYQDLPLMVRRAKAGLDQLRAQPGIDGKRIAAIGFCFGGSTVLNLARSGEPIQGVVSFHGGLKAALPMEPGAVKARVLVLHGGADPFVPPADVAGFMEEMTRAGAVWRMETYGGAVHSFSNPTAGADVKSGSAYDADAERRSLKAMDGFFAEIFAR
jgi:dienelactone hydrolase